MDRHAWEELNCRPRRAKAMGVDVAAGGRDNSCWTVVDRCGIIEQVVLDLDDTMQIAGRTIELMKKYSLAAGFVALDAGGGGKQIADRLREQGHDVKTVGFGEAAEAKASYKNKRAELYGGLRARLQDGGDDGNVFRLPPDGHALRQELAILPLQYDSEGRLELPPKHGTSSRAGEKTICQLLGRSPDRADSLVLAVWALDRSRLFSNHKEHVYWCEDDDVPMTAQDYAEMPEEMRGIFESSEYGRRAAWRIRYGREYDDDD
jgi:hypothetical protein